MVLQSIPTRLGTRGGEGWTITHGNIKELMFNYLFYKINRNLFGGIFPRIHVIQYVERDKV